MKGIRPLVLFATIFLTLVSCAPVLDRRLMNEGDRHVSFATLRENPEAKRGSLFILGGVIVRTRLTDGETRIEAMQVPVDGYGYFEESGRSEGRFLAVMPKEAAMLDPMIYRRGRRITMAGEFVGTRPGRIDEMEYLYPVFRIRQIYLWPREKRFYPPPYYYEPWFSPYPYFYGGPWWRYPFYPDPRVRPVVPRREQPPPQPAPPRREREGGGERTERR